MCSSIVAVVRTVSSSLDQSIQNGISVLVNQVVCLSKSQNTSIHLSIFFFPINQCTTYVSVTVIDLRHCLGVWLLSFLFSAPLSADFIAQGSLQTRLSGESEGGEIAHALEQGFLYFLLPSLVPRRVLHFDSLCFC